VGNGVENPTDGTGADVESADVAGRGAPALVGGGTKNQQVFEDAAGRHGLNEREGFRIAAQAFFQVDAARFAER